MKYSGHKKHINRVFWVYLGAWGLSFFLFLWQLLQRGRTLTESANIFFTEVAPNKTFLILLHLLFALLFLLFLAFRYLQKVFKRSGAKPMFKRLGLYFVLPFTLLFAGVKTLVHVNTYEPVTFSWDERVMNSSGRAGNLYELDGMHRGISVFGWRNANEQAIADLLKTNAEWVAIIPFMYQENEGSLELRPDRKDDAFNRNDSLFITVINDLHGKDIQVHLKPHLWLGQGWRSDITLHTDTDWDTWFNSYRSQILHYAKMAQLTGVELFCIGTELRTSIKTQPEAWHTLIADIRKIYDGQLTYAANWHDEYEYVTFWQELDYIGIQAYFPLTKTRNPDLEIIQKGWQPHIETLSAFSEKHRTPILFTEVGYKSESSATIKPWEWGHALQVLIKKKSDRTQYLAYEALFSELWQQDWFAGVYIWEWNTRSKKESADTDLDFSPRFKPAENVIAKWFGRQSH